MAMCGPPREQSTRHRRESVSVAESGEIQAVDTCGAGDSFIAHFVIAHLEGQVCRDTGGYQSRRGKCAGTSGPG